MDEPVSIIILNFNGKQYLQNCISSVLNQSYQNFEIILFDNGSSDGSTEFVRTAFFDSRINIKESKTNLGFAGGNNEAVKHTKNDLTVLLNNDTIVDKNWLKFLIDAIEEKNIVASSFVETEGVNPKYYESNGSVSFGMYNVMNIFDNIEDEFYPNGCSVIFRKSEIPVPFDPDYFYYSEDLYLGLKARFSGMKIKFVKESKVKHFGGRASTPNKTKTFYRERNRWLNLYTFFSVWFIFRIFPIISLVKTAKLFQSVFSSKYSFPGIVKSYFWFWLHISVILRKRKELKASRRVPEQQVIRYMTSRLLNHESAAGKIINMLSYMYCRLTGIKTIEYFNRK